MKNITNILLSLLFISISSIAACQTYQYTTENKKAVKYYDNAVAHYKTGDNENALKNLRKATEADDKFIEAWLLMGDIYADAGYGKLAIEVYEQAVAIDSTFFPGVYYFLGGLYYESEQYDNSIYNLKKYLSFSDLSNEMVEAAYSKLLLAETALALVNDSINVLPLNIGAPVNTLNDEYINYVSPEFDKLIFTKRSQENSSRRYKEQLYITEKIDSLWSQPRFIDIDWRDERYNMGTINFSTDGRVMYFTGCYWPDGFGSCDIYKSNRIGYDWLFPSNLGESINTEGWDSQPVISSDGNRLYFSSKRPGGKGGSDIWMSVKLGNSSWSPPVNLGDSINSSGNEMAPFLHADGRTLFYASTGHPGKGGFDLFVSRLDETGIWSKAKNIGYPVNTKFNEIIIFSSIDGKHNWISSDRAGGMGNYDIYYFQTYDEIAPERVMYVLGRTADKETKMPLNANVEITNLETGLVVNSTISDSVTGEFLIVLYPGVEYAFNISKKDYLFYSENINLKDTIANNYVNRTFYLSPVKKGSYLTLNNIFFEFNSSELMPSSYIELNKLIELLQNTSIDIDIIGHTDSIGSYDYNMSLSEDRSKSVGNYLINNGISGNRLNYIAKGSTDPVESNETEAGRAHNRRTEIIIR